MSFDELSDDVAFAPDHTPAPDRTAVSIRRSIASVESSLTEFDKIVAGLQALRAEHPIDLVFDVSTPKGMAEAIAHRAAWRDPRIAVEKFRKTAKQPVLTLGKDIDARAAWITEQLLEGETPVHEQIKAEEARRAQEKADREAAEFGRVMAMQEAVGEIAMLAMVNGLPSVVIAARLESLRAEVLDPKVYQEMLPQAEAARTAAIAKMEQGLKAAQWDEAEAKRKADEDARLRAEQADADAERARISAAQAEEAQRLQAARDMIAKAEREAAAERAQFERERAEFKAAQEKAAKELEARDSQQVLKAEAATPDATDRDAPVITGPSVGSMGAAIADPVSLGLEAVYPGAAIFYVGPTPVAADAGAAEEPTLTLGDIKERLAPLSITAEGLAQLGFVHAAIKGPSKVYLPSVWPAIKLAIMAHVGGLA